MKSSFMLRFMSIALSVLVLLSGLSVGIFANEETEEEQISPSDEQIVEEVPFEFPYLTGDMYLYELKDAVLDLSEVPAVISRAQIEEHDHVNRLYEQEPDEYTVIFQNRDGGKTVYVFDRPVKTQTADGAFADMTASAIVSASRGDNSVSMMAVGISNNTATTLKAMQSRLEAYKTALDLQPYNMLEDQMDTQTLTTAGIATDLSSPMQITPNNSTEVMSVSNTYSELAGEFALKNFGIGPYLRQINSSLQMYQHITLPYSKWLLTYVEEGYIIEAISKIGYVLAYDMDGADTVSLEQYYEGSLLDNHSFYWSIGAVYGTNYYHILAGSVGKLLSGNLRLSYNDGSDPVEVRWQFTNNLPYYPLQSISFEEGVLYAPDESVISLPTLVTNPTNASYASDETEYEWLSTNEELIYYDAFHEAYCTSFYSGVAQIYCRHRYTGIESVRLTVIVGYSEPGIQSGKTYILRKYETALSATTPALTMTVGSSSNTLSMATFQGTSAPTDRSTTYYAWYDRSQAFSITDNLDGTYRISAILSTKQYGAPNLYYNDIKTNRYTGSYSLVDKNTKPNTIALTSTNTIALQTYNANSDSQKWYVCKSGSVYYFFNKSNPNYYLAYASSGSSVTVTNGPSTSSRWAVTYFGVDLPSIKQVTSFYCGPASVLQILQCLNPSVPQSISNSTDLGVQTEVLAGSNYCNTGSATAVSKMRSTLQTLANSNYSLYPDSTNLTSNISTSLLNGYPLIAYINGKNNPGLQYYNLHSNDVAGGHYICVMGYDPITGLIAVSDCHYNSTFFGIHLVSATELTRAMQGKDGILGVYS